MTTKYLATYLNDHLAGSVMAMELLANLASTFNRTDVSSFALELREEVLADRKVLEGLMERLHISQSATRKTSAWVSEKLSQLKLRVDDPASGPLRLLESLEAISLGVEGKRLMWLALAHAAKSDADLRVTDYDRLLRRAEDQRQRVELLRVNAATEALLSTVSV